MGGQVQQHREAGGALDQGADHGPIEADDEVAFPVPGNCPILGFGGALTDPDLVGDELLAPSFGPGSWNTQSPAGAQTGPVDNFKKISSWAAILFAPTLVRTVYGMNFEHMPELHWVFGYPLSIALMAAVCASLYITFKRRDWL